MVPHIFILYILYTHHPLASLSFPFTGKLGRGRGILSLQGKKKKLFKLVFNRLNSRPSISHYSRIHSFCMSAIHFASSSRRYIYQDQLVTSSFCRLWGRRRRIEYNAIFSIYPAKGCASRPLCRNWNWTRSDSSLKMLLAFRLRPSIDERLGEIPMPSAQSLSLGAVTVRISGSQSSKTMYKVGSQIDCVDPIGTLHRLRGWAEREKTFSCPPRPYTPKLSH